MSQVASTVIPYLASKFGMESREFLKKELGYDFFGLLIKLAVYFVAAWVLDLYVHGVAGQQNWLTRLLGTFGGVGGFLSATIINYFTHPENQKVQYWVIVKGVAMFLIMLEAKNYYELNQSDNRKPSPFTLGIFALILTILGFWTFPDLMNKLKEFNLLNGINK